ncbi:MAG TPA: GAF domain-containing protein [Gaiellaceae bacterium]
MTEQLEPDESDPARLEEARLNALYAGALQRERQARADAEAAAATLRGLERVLAVALSQLPLPELLQALVARIVEVLQADMAVLLLSGDDGLQHVRAMTGVDEELSEVSPIPAGAGITGLVASTRKPVLVPDLSRIELAGTMLTRRGVNSVVSVPLIVADSVFGVIHVGSEAYAQFTEEDARLLGLIADRIALAIDQAALADAERAAQERLRVLADQLAFLAEASALLGVSLDVDATLAQLGALVAGRIADWCTIHLADDGGARLVAVAHPDPARAAAAREVLSALQPPPRATDGVGHVIATGRAELHPAVPPAQLNDLAREAGVHSMLIVPLVARGRTLGAMSWAWAETGATYDEGDLELALDLAGRAAVAIDNAQLYAEAEEQAQAARVLESVGDGVFLVDRNGIVRTWNHAAAAATSLPAQNVLGRHAVEAIPGWAAVAGRVPVAPVGSLAQRAESLPLDLGGGRELWLSLHGVAVPDGTVYAFRDLTDDRALETMRSEFVATVSHELRTPLAAIYGAAMTLRRSDVALDEAQRSRMLDVVSGEADRLARTVNDILWASRLDVGSLHVAISTCDLAALAGGVIEAQRAHLDRAHELVLVVGKDVPEVAGDPDKVGRILINLVDNAIKYSPDGGRVELRLRRVGGNVRLSVIDAGLGIPAAERRRVFEKFYRLDPDMTRGVGGTGLGLYICRELVRRMSGRIWVDSAPRTRLPRSGTWLRAFPTPRAA